MKKILIWAVMLVMMACQAEPEKSFTLTGKIAGLTEGVAYLQDRIAGQMVPVDTAVIAEGVFTFTGKMEHPELLYVRVDGIRTQFSVFIENSDIFLDIDSENPADYTVTGSGSHDIMANLSKQTASYDENLRALQQQILEAEVMENIMLADELRKQHTEVDEQRTAAIKNYVAGFPKEPAAVYVAMRQLAHGLNAEALGQIVSLFDTSLEGTRYYDDLKSRIAVLESVAIGKQAIDFKLTDPEGAEVSLSDFRGQYVLINFWASWCPYCRQENPHLVKVYERFGSDSFEILGVSLDRENEPWLKGIADDGLTWPQVSDLLGWNSGPAALYAVKSIPQNVLIDPQGIIIARNLKDKELDDKLEALLQPV